MNLPTDYKKEIEKILRNEEEYKKFIESYNKPSFKGIRINTLKVSEDRFKEIFKFKIKKSNFAKNSYYLEENIDSIGNLPLHHAGAFYVQEPSASSAVTVLSPVPGDKVLDLCAAPGGKSTQIASYLNGKGLLWSNEIVKNRAKVLLSNMERMGVKNAVISSCHPETLCKRLTGFFDKVLVDAPCSGEGMFRKNPYAMKEWSQEHVKMCAKRQLSILNTATKALKDGGIMVYSTCTFSLEENEQTVYNFLKENPDFALENIDCDFGRAAQQLILDENLVDTSRARRIFPQDGGEGHFVAKFKKKSANSKKVKDFNYKKAKAAENKIGYDYFSTLFKCEAYGKIEKISNNFIILPEGLPDISGLNVLRAGVLLATNKGSILEPAHAAFMAAKAEELRTKIDFSCDSKEILAYLKGEEISVPEDMCGYVGVCVDGIVAGYAKAINGRLKNKYPKGLRIF